MEERLTAIVSVSVGAAITLGAVSLANRCCWTASSGNRSCSVHATQHSPAQTSADPRRAGRGAGADVAGKFGLKRHTDSNREATGRTRALNPSPAPTRFVQDYIEDNEVAEQALDDWGRIVHERGGDVHPLTALQADGRFTGDAGLRLTVGVRRACLAAVVFAEDQYSACNALHLPRIVGDRPEWGKGTEEQRLQEEEAEAEAEQQLRQELEIEERIRAEVDARFNEWLVAERAENLYLDTIPQERQQHEKARIRQQVSHELDKRSGSGRSSVVPEAVAKMNVADFATTVLGLRVRVETSPAEFSVGPGRQVSHLVLEKPGDYVSYSSHRHQPELR